MINDIINDNIIDLGNVKSWMEDFRDGIIISHEILENILMNFETIDKENIKDSIKRVMNILENI